MEALERRYLERTISLFAEEACSTGHFNSVQCTKTSKSVSTGTKSN